jgi:hypothetical protein
MRPGEDGDPVGPQSRSLAERKSTTGLRGNPGLPSSSTAARPVFYEDETNRPLEKGTLDGTMSGEGGSRRMSEGGPGRVGEKVAIVTAAGSGMGAACARELASRGYAVALMSPSGKAEDLAKELGGLGVTGSVTEEADLGSLVDKTLSRYGRIDGVVNSTGHPPSGEILELTDEQWHDALDLVVLNVVRIARLVTPAMQRQGGRRHRQRLHLLGLRAVPGVPPLFLLARRSGRLHQALR